MSNFLKDSPHSHPAPIVILESEPGVRLRLGRALSAACGFESVTGIGDILDFDQSIGEETRQLVVPDTEIDIALHYGQSLERLNLICLARTFDSTLLGRISETPRFNHVVGWPDFMTVPRPWDLSMATRMSVDSAGINSTSIDSTSGSMLSTRHILPEGVGVVTWRPRTTFDRDAIVERVNELVGQVLDGGRHGEEVGEVAYEMLMNAMYDAPVDAAGQPKYGYQRDEDITLDEHERPEFCFASDGSTVVLEVTDPFGRLERSHVLDSITRGVSARSSTTAKDILNTQSGGAGLGVFRMFQNSTALIFAAQPGKATRVIAVFDLELRLRDRRTYPTSLHLFF